MTNNANRPFFFFDDKREGKQDRRKAEKAKSERKILEKGASMVILKFESFFLLFFMNENLGL